jgi:hypothetical protein
MPTRRPKVKSIIDTHHFHDVKATVFRGGDSTDTGRHRVFVTVLAPGTPDTCPCVTDINTNRLTITASEEQTNDAEAMADATPTSGITHASHHRTLYGMSRGQICEMTCHHCSAASGNLPPPH